MMSSVTISSSSQRRTWALFMSELRTTRAELRPKAVGHEADTSMPFQQWRGRLLVLTTRLPYPPTTGFQMRTWQVIRALAAEGCEIHLLSLDNPASPDASAPELLRVCESVEVIPFAQTSLSSSRNYLERLVAFTS